MSTNADLKTNAAAAALSSAHFSVRTAMPLLLGVLATGYGFSDGQIGVLGSAYSVGATLVALTSVIWMRGKFLRLSAALLLILGTIALAGVALTRSDLLAVAAFGLAGIGYGGVYALMLLLYSIPALIGVKDGVYPAIAAIVATNLICGCGAFLLPDRLTNANQAIDATRRVDSAAGGSGGVSSALIGLGAFYLGITGGWSFLGRVAGEAGLTTKYAGTILAIGTATSSAVALLAGRMGERGARRTSMATAIAAMLAGLALIGLWPTRLGYAVGSIVFIGLATFVLTFGSGIIARLEPSGRATGLAAAALGAGSSLVVGLAAYLLAHRRLR